MNFLLIKSFRFRRWPSTAVVVCAYLGIAFAAQDSFAQKQIPKPGDERSCTASACHDDYAKKKVVHSPVSSDACDACHEISDENKHSFEFTEEGGALCMDCHEDDFEGEVLHSPFEQGECLSCHQPHASDTKSLLITPTVGELCMECHEEVTEDLKYQHGPVGAGACTSCHNPHTSDHPKMLFAEGRKMCAKCHSDVSVKIDRGPFVHEPAKEDCMGCHILMPVHHSLLLVLDGVADPGNMGAILRTAAAADVDGVLLAPGCVDIYIPKVVRSAMGAQIFLPTQRDDWFSIQQSLTGLKLWLAFSNNGIRYDQIDWSKPSALLIGGEAAGASPEALQITRDRVTIPLHRKVESLNAAVAAGIILFEATRQKAS